MSASHEQPRRLTLRRKLLFALVTTAAFFVSLELLLLLARLPTAEPPGDPWVGFAKHIRLFEPATDELGRKAMRTNPVKLTWFNPQQFPQPKPEGVRRIFTLGGSTTYGRPYDDETSFSGWLREYLAAADGAGSWEVINAGGVSYASYRVANVMEELAELEPDLFIVYSAHNEFLERRTYANVFENPTTHRVGHWLSRTRTWRLAESLLGTRQPTTTDKPPEILPEEVDEILNHTAGPVDYHRDLEWRRNVVRHYRWNLQRMIQIARAADAEIVFVAPASNESGCAPFKSEFSEQTSAEQQSRVFQLLDEAQTLLQQADSDGALKLMKRAVELDPMYALSQFRHGQAALRAGDTQAAAAAFTAAIEQDVCPLRAPRAVREAIDEVCRREGVPVVDFEERLRDVAEAESGRRILGDELFLDHVHPTVDGHRQLALQLLEGMRQTSLRPPTLTAAASRKAEAAVREKIDPQKQGVGLRNLAKVCHWAGKFEEAARHAEAALEKLDSDPESMYLLADCRQQLGRDVEAFGVFHELLAAHPDYDRARIPFGALFYHSGDYAEAKEQLTLGLLAYPDSPTGYYWLGASHLALGEWESAAEALRHSLSLAPDDPGALFALGQALAGAGRTDEAVKSLEAVLQLAPGHVETQLSLGRLALDQGDRSAAASWYGKVLEQDPENADARAGLEAAASADTAGASP